MSDTKTVQFFDNHADRWDSYQTSDVHDRINDILRRVEFFRGDRVLDVACGTGILIPFLLDCGLSPKAIFAIDISPKMIEQFQKKFAEIQSVSGKYEAYDFKGERFDKIIIFNAFPHFSEPSLIFRRSYELLRSGGELIVAHSMNRSALDKHHAQVEGVVSSHRLISDQAFRDHLESEGFSDIVVEDGDYFFLRGRKDAYKGTD